MTIALTPELTTYRWSSNDEADQFTVEDPATGEVIALIQGSGPEQVAAAVEAASRAFERDWRWRTPAERAGLLMSGADVLEAHADELALLLSRENGKPVQDARQNDVDFLSAITPGASSPPLSPWATQLSSSRASRTPSRSSVSSNC
jgi:acyl-CoA reductase-like NAD-dependent aldehyde dehydrogenase